MFASLMRPSAGALLSQNPTGLLREINGTKTGI
jgi:hypothetical protein